MVKCDDYTDDLLEYIENLNVVEQIDKVSNNTEENLTDASSGQHVHRITVDSIEVTDVINEEEMEYSDGDMAEWIYNTSVGDPVPFLSDPNPDLELF